MARKKFKVKVHGSTHSTFIRIFFIDFDNNLKLIDQIMAVTSPRQESFSPPDQVFYSITTRCDLPLAVAALIHSLVECQTLSSYMGHTSPSQPVDTS